MSLWEEMTLNVVVVAVMVVVVVAIFYTCSCCSFYRGAYRSFLVVLFCCGFSAKRVFLRNQY